jgi:uncharacterized protein
LTPKTTERYTIPGPAGALEIARNAPPHAPRGIALVAHPNPVQGGTLDNKVAVTLAKTFHALGYAVTRFNFRGVGRSEGSFDDGEGETQDALAALSHAREKERASGDAHASGSVAPRELPVVLAGFSFGTYVQARVAQTVAAERLVLVGPAVQRIGSLALPQDTVVVHGEEDDIVPLADVLAWARPRPLPIVVFPGCGHFFHGRLTELQRVITGMWHAHGVAQGA